MTKVTNLGTMTGVQTGTYAEVQIFNGKRRGILKFDWTVNVGAPGTLVFGCLGKISSSDQDCFINDINGTKMLLTEAAFGSPGGVGTYSYVVEVWLSPFMSPVVAAANDASNTLEVFLIEE